MDEEHIADERTRPTADHPLHGERRPLATPILAVLGLVAAIAVVFLVITWLRYST